MLIFSARICPALLGFALSYSDLQAFAQHCSASLGVACPYSDLLDVAHFPSRLQLLAFARAWLPGVLPSRTELENKVRFAFLSRLQQQPQHVQPVQAPEPLVAASDVGTAFVAIVPRRRTSPARAPSSWTRLYTLLTLFEGRRGVSYAWRKTC